MQRGFIGFLKSYYPEPLQIAEVGVKTGEHALFILNTLLIENLFLIDPYVEYLVDDSSVSEPYTITQAQIDESLQTMFNAIQPFAHKVTCMRMYSLVAVKTFPNRSLDAVYIDANHSRPHIDNDIEAWYPKVRYDGVLAGHDYGIPSVKAAVDKFLTRVTVKQAQVGEDWIIVK